MSEKEMFELTTPQKSIWMMEQFYKGTNINNICATLTINMDVDMEKLNKAINIFVQNNKSFGLNFKLQKGELKQYFTKLKDIKFEQVKLKDEKEVKKLATETAEEIFDIEGEKLFTFKLYKLENNYGGYVVMTHHLISDAATMSIIGKETTEIYAKLVSGEEIEEKEYSYEQYILDEKEYVKSSKFNKDKQYWTDNFTTIPEVATIPVTSENSHADLTGKAKRKEFTLNIDLLKRIAEFCAQNKISNYNFFMAVYAIYLSRVSNLKDFVIGTPILNRTNFKEKHTTGMFINTAPLRIKIEDNIDFISFVKSIAQSSMSMLRYQKYSYQMLLEELRKTNNNLPTLYDVMLSYQVTKANDRDSKIPYEVEWLPTTTISNGVYVHLHDNDDAGTLNVAYDYQIEKYTGQDMTNMHNRILHIIEQVLENKNYLEKEIEIVTPEEKHQILNVFNNTYKDYPREKTIVDLFEEQVEKTPDNVAVVCGNEQITYKELNEKANGLAKRLLDEGMQSGDTVSIRLERTLNMIISIIACIKAGFTYILIENSLPKERIDYILKNSKSKVIITSENLNKEKLDTKVFILNEKDIIEKTENIKVANDRLCIIYTSGSTGNPKGVVLSQKGFANLVYAMNDAMKLEICDKFISHASVSFDMFAFELYCTLLNGKTLYLTSDLEQKNPTAMSKIIMDNNIDFMLTTPSKIELILANEKLAKSLANIKVFLLGGEVFTASLYNRMKKITKGNIYNGYGPTEITACCSIKKIEDGKEINIGKPVKNARIYILDERLTLCPNEIVGELSVAGEGLAFGYLNNEELTSQKFLEIKSIGEKVYRTGDLAKYNANGEIEYIGRNDFQVKLHGQRIELGEIEKKILEIKEIHSVCVCIKKIKNREILSAYYTSNQPVDKSLIKKSLEKVLPQYMIPAYFLQLEEIPLTINGKVDRKRLPDPKIKETKKEKIVLPKNRTEEEILKIFKSVLNLKNISTTDDFFDLGGDSLAAINASTKINDKLETKVSIKNIFDNPTIVELSQFLETEKINNEIEKIEKVDKREYYPTSSAQKRMYYATLADGKDSILYNISGGLILGRKPNIKKLNESFKKLIKNNESLRTYFEVIDGEIMQKIRETVEFEIVDETVNHSNIEKLAEDFIKPFDLSKAPLIRAKIVTLKDNKTVLLIDIHHIIGDGETIKIITKEISDLYNGKDINKKEIEYKDFALWENKKQFKKEEKYWLSVYEKEIPVLEMPTNFPRPAVQSFEGNSISLKINNKETIENIRETCRKLNITPYMLLIGVYYILLYEYSGSNDIVIGTPIVGRSQEQLQNIVGMFVNTLAIRNKINKEETFEELIKQVKANCLQAFENQEYPFDRLIKKLEIQKDTSRNALFDVLFTYHNTAYPIMQFGKINAKCYTPKTNISKFDISLEAILEEEVLNLKFEYCTKLFKEDFIENMSKHYINILNTILNNVQVKISDIEITLSNEKSKILRKINNIHAQYERNKTVTQLFEEQVEKTPNKVAVFFENDTLTYKELNQKANQLAKHMKDNYNIKEHDKVAIFVQKSLESILSILATIKLGAAFVPIDVEYPDERIDYILNDSESKLILTTRKYENKIKTDIAKLSIDINNNIYEDKADSNLEGKIKANDLIYIMYTSGSTGRPKGVMVEHRNVVRLVKNTNYIDFSKCQRILQTGSIVFDACTFEIWGALLNGLSLYVISKKHLLDTKILEGYLIENKIDTLWLTAPLFNQLSEENPYMFRKVKYLLTGGDVLSPKHINMVKDANPNITLINGYGPTENTTFSCCFTIDRKYETSIPIGKPIANSTAYIVSKCGKIQPEGVPGELWVGGDGVSKGYLNRKDLTEEKFITNPFGKGMVYKTGDLVKLLPDGNIEFIGRIDNQVKIRGFRVEISEIDNAIKKYPGISKLHTIVKEINGSKVLVTYFTAERKINIQDLVLYLQERLPQYMIPQYMMQLDTLPLTINGKVDKTQLPTPQIEAKTKYVAPENEVQEQLCDIWCKIFNMKKIGIMDNFFELGGDSLLAIKLQTEALKQNININYSDVFEYQTIKSLSEKKQDKKLYYIDENYDYSKINELIKINNISNIDKDNKEESIGNLLLFGATGFLGTHILDEYLSTNNGNIYCMVRRKNNEDSEQRLKSTLKFYFDNKYDNEFGKRIFVIYGDITKKNFGLDAKEYELLGKQVNTVVNSAALVKHFGDFDMFKSINVAGTKNIIKYCKEFDKKLYHISTMSVAGMSGIDEDIQSDEERILFSEDKFYIGQNLNNAYVYTKFQAEKEILEQISNGLNACILRMGNIFNRVVDGRFQINVSENAYINRIKAILNLGVVQNRFLNHALEFTPVDYSAKAILTIMKHNAKFNILHLFNTKLINFPNIIAILNDLGYNIKIVSDKEFAEKVKEFLKDEKLKNQITGLIPDLKRDKTLGIVAKTLPNAYFTTRYLKSVGFEWPEIDKEYVEQFLQYFKKIGYIE